MNILPFPLNLVHYFAPTRFRLFTTVRQTEKQTQKTIENVDSAGNFDHLIALRNPRRRVWCGSVASINLVRVFVHSINYFHPRYYSLYQSCSLACVQCGGFLVTVRST